MRLNWTPVYFSAQAIVQAKEGIGLPTEAEAIARYLNTNGDQNATGSVQNADQELLLIDAPGMNDAKLQRELRLIGYQTQTS